MRKRVVDENIGILSYEIRNIVKIAKKIESYGVNITWENIGDPVSKGEQVPEWIKDIVLNLVKENSTWAYSPSKGLENVRKFLAELVNKNPGAKITEEDIIFFNGVGDIISKLYFLLDRESRVIGPSPSYPTHSSAEAAHALSPHLTYELNPNNGWLPNLEDMRNKVANNQNIVGILVVSPNNPTGTVYPRETMQGIVDIAREFGLLVICDEIYLNLNHNVTKVTPLSEVIGEVCGLSLKGISKEVPWPGSRCGWVEAYNHGKDSEFAKYFKALEDAKMMEVCSTTLPQAAIPLIFSDNRYPGHIAQRNLRFKEQAELAYNLLKDVKGIKVVKPNGAFYMTILFEDNVLNTQKTLPIENQSAREYVESITKGVEPDVRFAYYLLGSTGICVVPLTGFCCKKPGFRITLLETDIGKFRTVIETIKAKIAEYLRQ